VISENQKQFEQLKSGKDRLKGFFCWPSYEKNFGKCQPTSCK